jgi:hypothetical protein
MEEIQVPKHVRQFMLDGAIETKLGDKKGAKKQYRYGNLHIREYDAYIYKMKKDSLLKKPQSIISGLAASLATGYASYVISKKLKE